MRKSFAFIIYGLWGVAVYGLSWGYNFLLDDQFQIVQNPQVHELSQIFLTFGKSTMATGENIAGIYYKPVMMMAYNLLWNLGHGSPAPFHIFQLLIHVCNAFLIFTLFQKILSAKNSAWAFFAGLLFLCHPVNSEAVLMIADLQEPLYTFFGLLALWSLVSLSLPWLAALFLLFSLLSKETGVLYLAICGVYCALFCKERMRPALISIALAGGVYMALRLGVAQLNTVVANNMQIMRADVMTRLLTMPKALIHYIHLFFFPKDLSLTQDWVVSVASFENFWWPLMQVLILVSAILFYAFKKKQNTFLFFALWFLLGWAVHSQIVPLDGTVSDRWFYFPIVGFIGMLVVVLQSFELSPKAILVLLAVTAVPLSVRSFVRSQDWQDAKTLFEHDLAMQPESFYLNNDLGLELMAQRRTAEAISYLEKTIAVSPKGSHEWLVGWRNLGGAYLDLGQFAKAEECFRISLADPDVKSLRAFALALQEQNKTAKLKEFLEKVALPQYPQDPVLIRIKNQNP